MVLKIIYTVLISTFLILSSTGIVYGQSAGYEFTERRFNDTPIFCIIENTQYRNYLGYIAGGIRDWEKTLQDSVSTQEQRDKWRIIVSSVESTEWWCDVRVYMVTNTDSPCSDDAWGCTVRSSNAIYFSMNNIYPIQYFQTTSQHETGHILGLGHYKSESEKQNKAWQTSVHAPSVMITGSHDEPRMLGITQLDVYTIKQIYGDGFRDPARDTTKQEQSEKDEQKTIITKPIPEWFKKNAEWWLDGLITDRDFLNAIKYMLNEGFGKHPIDDTRVCIESSGDIWWLASDIASWIWGGETTFDQLVGNLAINCHLD